jgi:hypothetical protein
MPAATRSLRGPPDGRSGCPQRLSAATANAREIDQLFRACGIVRCGIAAISTRYVGLDRRDTRPRVRALSGPRCSLDAGGLPAPRQRSAGYATGRQSRGDSCRRCRSQRGRERAARGPQIATAVSSGLRAAGAVIGGLRLGRSEVMGGRASRQRSPAWPGHRKPPPENRRSPRLRERAPRPSARGNSRNTRASAGSMKRLSPARRSAAARATAWSCRSTRHDGCITISGWSSTGSSRAGR